MYLKEIRPIFTDKMNIKLIKATHNDLDVLTEMYTHLREDEKVDNLTDEKETTRLLKFYINRDEILLFSSPQRLYGFCIVVKSSTPVKLLQFFVKRKYRRMGVGTFVMRQLFLYGDIDVEVINHNKSAIQFYKDLGFKKRYVGMRRICEDSSYS